MNHPKVREVVECAVRRHYATKGVYDRFTIDDVTSRVMDNLNPETIEFMERDPEARWLIEKIVALGDSDDPPS